MRTLVGLVIVSGLLIAGCSDSDSPTGPTVGVTLQAAPAEGTVITDFTFQATGSTTGTGALEYRWDWDGDGTWDTGWSSDDVAVHRFSEGGTISVLVQVSSGSSTDTDSVSVVVDGRHGYIEDMYDLPTLASGTGLAYDGTQIWVTNWGLPIYKLDAVTGDSLGSIPGNSGWTGGITWDGTYLWTVGYSGEMKIFKQDPADGSILDSFSVIYSADASGLDWDGSVFYYGSSVGTSGGDGLIHIYSPEGTELSSFPSPRGSDDPDGVAFDGVNVWVTIGAADSIYVVDPADGEVLRVLPAPGLGGNIEIIEDHLVIVISGDPPGLARMVP